MADEYYDPFSMDGQGGDDTPADMIAAPTSTAAAGDGKIKLTDADIKEILNEVVNKFENSPTKPWQDFEKTGNPDLSLYEPTCSIDNWTHTDVELKVGEGIAYLIFNRPEANNQVTNSLNLAFLDATHLLHKREDIRVVVLTARGTMFCAGKDPNWDGVPTGVKVTPEVEKAREAMYERAMASGRFNDRSEMILVPHLKGMWNFCTLPQLTVCLVNGSAMGYGLGFIGCCDVVISVKNAFFSMTEVKNGVCPAMIGPYICLKMRMSFAKRLLMQGLTHSAEEMHENSFINMLVDDMAQANEKLKEVCAKAVESSPAALCQAKRCAFGVSGRPVTNEAMWFTIKELNTSLKGDFQKGVEAPWKNSKITVLEPPPWQ
mmetsp:Transcript_90027/g.155966  ORF Transcript_90027/g.155966 Transcript_90027/m.155966 type:complete len:375 (+) Transcript_90027:68-1192(+)